ncbi:MAG TPA: hypothetical protein VFX16_06875 [Pseudonocardiaceae bacterium]|nr:hypothetical protein [Pseudonocardiaceae bacterium]
MLKKAGIVTAAAVALSLVAAPAFAATTVAPQDGPQGPSYSHDHGDSDFVSFGDAYRTFIWGGGSLGAGAAALVAGAYAGIATTPAEILGSLEHHHHHGH